MGWTAVCAMLDVQVLCSQLSTIIFLWECVIHDKGDFKKWLKNVVRISKIIVY